MDESSFRRRSHRESNGFQSGYVPVDDEYLQHSGIRGKRSCCLCALLVVLLLVAVINALVTVGLVYFMSVTHEGMGSIEFLPGGRYLRALFDVHVVKVKINNGMIHGRYGKDLTIDGQKVLLNQSADTLLSVEDSGTVITAKDIQFITQQGKQLFSPSYSSVASNSFEAVNLHASEVDVGSVSSLDGIPDLHLKSYHDLTVFGMEGITAVTQGDLVLKAQEITFNSTAERQGFKSHEGVFLSPDLPVGNKDSKQAGVVGQLKLCVCWPSGKIFAVPVVDMNSGCHRANEDVNPCDT